MAFEMRCYRRILNVGLFGLWEKITNEEQYKNNGHRIKERKLKLFRQIRKMEGNRLVKEVVFGDMGGKTKRRSRREWVDDYKGMVQRGDNYMYRLRTKRKDAIKAHGKK